MSVGVTFLPPGEQVSGGGVLVIFRGLEPQLEGEEPRILIKTWTAAVRRVLSRFNPRQVQRLAKWHVSFSTQ